MLLQRNADVARCWTRSVVWVVTPSRLQGPVSEVSARGDNCSCFHSCHSNIFFLLYLAVIAIDTSETRLRLARHNAIIYGVQDRIEFILGDYVSFVRAYVSLPEHSRTAIDVVFLSPPWGGVDYTSSPQKQPLKKEGDDGDTTPDVPSYNLDRIKPLPGADLFHLTRRITPHIAYYLPRHVNLQQISELLPETAEATCAGDSSKQHRLKGEKQIEVQEAWMGNKLKAVTCYFGGLVEGQEHLFPS
jgi:trimethylguanosine synthase